MTIKLDSTRHSTVVTCTACPHWFGFATDKIDGWRVGAGHEQAIHPELEQARKALDAATRRRAG